MELIDFTASPARAFRRGFLKGLAAPCLLFADFPPPPLPQVRPLPAPAPLAPLPALSGADAERLGRAWAAIGHDMARVLARHAPAEENR